MKENSYKVKEGVYEDPTCYKCNCRNHCSIGRPNKDLETCPITVSPDVQERAIKLYHTDEFIKKSNYAATIVKEYGSMPRLKDTIEYARRMGFEKLGIASCAAYQKETVKTAEILSKYGFNVSSVCCPTGVNKKLDGEIPEDLKAYYNEGYNLDCISCNPVAQALLLSKAKTDMNIVIGLCIGHDVTFNYLSEAPVTTLIVKDRVNRNNPAATLSNRHGDYSFSIDL
ncbi:MAG: DUF1847 domain-containing protein [Promethearchaeota archaeon]|jgi:uncharacterized metal-binding protein